MSIQPAADLITKYAIPGHNQHTLHDNPKGDHQKTEETKTRINTPTRHVQASEDEQEVTGGAEGPGGAVDVLCKVAYVLSAQPQLINTNQHQSTSRGLGRHTWAVYSYCKR